MGEVCFPPPKRLCQGYARSLPTTRPSVGWVRESAQKQQTAGTGIPDAQDERMVGAEDGRRWRRLHRHSACSNCHDGRRGGFGALFVHLHLRLVERFGNTEVPHVPPRPEKTVFGPNARA